MIRWCPHAAKSGKSAEWGDLLFEFPAEARLTVYRRFDIPGHLLWRVGFVEVRRALCVRCMARVVW